tara:strand:- start:4908 stop:5414 length:507 start_codon:yes stop_codon:yes gene_type:complete
MKRFIAVIALLVSLQSFSQTFCDCNNNMTVYRHVWEESGLVVFDSFYLNTQDLLSFTAAWGTKSPHVWDFDGDGFVSTSDKLLFFSGYGQTYQGDFNLCDVTVLFWNSHGLPSTYPEAYFAIIHTSLFDEDLTSGDGWGACPLNTVYVEIIYNNHPEIIDHVEKFYMR